MIYVNAAIYSACSNFSRSLNEPFTPHKGARAHQFKNPKINATKTQPSRLNRKTTAQPDCDSAIGQHLLKNIECARTMKTPNSQF